MVRIARIILPNVPHHVTQRGNRRQRTFFCDSDYSLYLNLLFEWCFKFEVHVDAYCLMPNHVHLILIPKTTCGVTKALTEVHRRYTCTINIRNSWRGCLWQGRFFSVPLNDQHYENAIRYVELNPVRANIVKDPRLYPWSSALKRVRSSCFWQEPFDAELFRKITRSGRPDFNPTIAERILNECQIDIFPKRRGPKVKKDYTN